MFHYIQIPTTKQFAIMFVCQLWRVSPLFCLLFTRRFFFSRCSKTHICILIWSLMWHFLTPFPHLIFIISNGLLSQKIISTSYFFPKKLCRVSYFFMFLIYLPSGKAIVQLLLSPSLQFYRNTICISRYKVICSMGWITHLHKCALNDTKQFSQHLDICTSASHKTWPCTR
jgi:hypothetical protein